MVLPVVMHAQDTIQLTFNDAVNKGISNSKQLQIMQAKVSEAKARTEQARDRMYPELSVSGTMLELNSPHTKMDLPSNPSDTAPAGPGFQIPEIHTVMLGQVNVSEPVFAGFKIKNGIAASNFVEKAAEFDAKATRSNVALGIIKALYQYYQLDEARKLLVHNKEQAHQRVLDFTNMEENGIISKNDLLRAKLRESNIDLKLNDMESNMRVANYNIGIILGLPDTAWFQLDTTGMFSIPQIGMLPDLIKKGLDNRNNIKSAEMTEQASEAGIKVAKGDYYPSLAITGSYVNAYIPNFITVTNAANAGIGLKYSISGALEAHQKVQEAEAKKQQASLNRELQEDHVKMQISKSYNNYQQALKKIDISKNAIEKAQENFRITKNKYNNQLVLFTDYLDADV